MIKNRFFTLRKSIFILGLGILILPNLVYGQFTCNFHFSLMTTDSCSKRERNYDYNELKKIKYHDYDFSIIIDDSLLIFKDNTPVNRQENRECYVNAFNIKKNMIGVSLFMGSGYVDVSKSLQIDIVSKSDTMSIKLIRDSIDFTCLMALDSIPFIPGKFEFDIGSILIKRYGVRRFTNSKGINYYYPKNEPSGARYNITPFEWTEKREED